MTTTTVASLALRDLCYCEWERLNDYKQWMLTDPPKEKDYPDETPKRPEGRRLFEVGRSTRSLKVYVRCLSCEEIIDDTLLTCDIHDRGGEVRVKRVKGKNDLADVDLAADSTFTVRCAHCWINYASVFRHWRNLIDNVGPIDLNNDRTASDILDELTSADGATVVDILEFLFHSVVVPFPPDLAGVFMAFVAVSTKRPFTVASVNPEHLSNSGTPKINMWLRNVLWAADVDDEANNVANARRLFGCIPYSMAASSDATAVTFGRPALSENFNLNLMCCHLGASPSFSLAGNDPRIRAEWRQVMGALFGDLEEKESGLTFEERVVRKKKAETLHASQTAAQAVKKSRAQVKAFGTAVSTFLRDSPLFSSIRPVGIPMDEFRDNLYLNADNRTYYVNVVIDEEMIRVNLSDWRQGYEAINKKGGGGSGGAGTVVAAARQELLEGLTSVTKDRFGRKKTAAAAATSKKKKGRWTKTAEEDKHLVFDLPVTPPPPILAKAEEVVVEDEEEEGELPPVRGDEDALNVARDNPPPTAVDLKDPPYGLSAWAVKHGCRTRKAVADLVVGYMMDVRTVTLPGTYVTLLERRRGAARTAHLATLKSAKRSPSIGLFPKRHLLFFRLQDVVHDVASVLTEDEEGLDSLSLTDLAQVVGGVFPPHSVEDDLVFDYLRERAAMANPMGTARVFDLLNPATSHPQVVALLKGGACAPVVEGVGQKTLCGDPTTSGMLPATCDSWEDRVKYAALTCLCNSVWRTCREDDRDQDPSDGRKDPFVAVLSARLDKKGAKVTDLASAAQDVVRSAGLYLVSSFGRRLVQVLQAAYVVTGGLVRHHIDAVARSFYDFFTGPGRRLLVEIAYDSAASRRLLPHNHRTPKELREEVTSAFDANASGAVHVRDVGPAIREYIEFDDHAVGGPNLFEAAASRSPHATTLVIPPAERDYFYDCFDSKRGRQDWFPHEESHTQAFRELKRCLARILHKPKYARYVASWLVLEMCRSLGDPWMVYPFDRAHQARGDVERRVRKLHRVLFLARYWLTFFSGGYSWARLAEMTLDAANLRYSHFKFVDLARFAFGFGQSLSLMDKLDTTPNRVKGDWGTAANLVALRCFAHRRGLVAASSSCQCYWDDPLDAKLAMTCEPCRERLVEALDNAPDKLKTAWECSVEHVASSHRTTTRSKPQVTNRDDIILALNNEGEDSDEDEEEEAMAAPRSSPPSLFDNVKAPLRKRKAQPQQQPTTTAPTQ